MSDWFRPTIDGALIFLRVTPNAGRDSIEEITTLADGTTVLKIKIKAQPEDGKANKAAIALLARISGLSKSAFTVKSGATARTKTILVTGTADRTAAARAALEGAVSRA